MADQDDTLRFGNVLDDLHEVWQLDGGLTPSAPGFASGLQQGKRPALSYVVKPDSEIVWRGLSKDATFGL